MPERTTAVPAEERNSGPPAADSARIAADAITAARIAGKCKSTTSRRSAGTPRVMRSRSPGKEIPPLRLHAESPVTRDVEDDQRLRRREARERAAVGRPHRLGEAEQIEADRAQLTRRRIEHPEHPALRPHVVGDREEVPVRLPRHPR